ncbi:G1 family glutamic endopeptidase [Cohnella nanjingensis]|uniref:G1 family glutamic endopeptidase n=1 Tax=Cohnella nanjingensis TaxID=1387779 RepID=UPI001C87A9CB|nr:G1 family glutamic endopeptidase [Cohnella nanjingensis]
MNAALHSGFGWSSANWAGYAISGGKGTMKRISASWTVPAVQSTARSAFSSAWIGIDGFNNTSLIQTGTSHDYVNGQARYEAWWEILPAAETVIPLPVHAGDRMQAVIAKLSGTRWSIRLRNATQKWTFQTVQSYNGPQSTAEWIVEAPLVNGTLTSLVRFRPIVITQCRLNGKIPKLKFSDRGYMLRNGKIVAIPSLPNRAGDAFVVRSVVSSPKS